MVWHNRVLRRHHWGSIERRHTSSHWYSWHWSRKTSHWSWHLLWRRRSDISSRSQLVLLNILVDLLIASLLFFKLAHLLRCHLWHLLWWVLIIYHWLLETCWHLLWRWQSMLTYQALSQGHILRRFQGSRYIRWDLVREGIWLPHFQDWLPTDLYLLLILLQNCLNTVDLRLLLSCFGLGDLSGLLCSNLTLHWLLRLSSICMAKDLLELTSK